MNKTLQVFHATMIGREARNCVAIKVVRMENLRETKPKWLVTHELQMLELAKRDGRQSVVHLIEGFDFSENYGVLNYKSMY